MFKKLVLITVVGLSVGTAFSGCSSSSKEDMLGDVNSLYNQGLDSLMAQEFAASVHTFEELERQHPFSGWATRAQMMMAYAQFRQQKYGESIATIDRFIRLHPGHENLPYMYYLRAMNHYVRISDVKRDQSQTQAARDGFESVIQRFPESRYASNARLKLTLTKDHMAGKEMSVGRFYQEKGKHLAAMNRFKRVVEAYQTTSQMPEALYRLAETYFALGLDNQAQKSAAVLGHNYPDSNWYTHAYGLLNKEGYLENGVWKEDKGGILDKLKSAFN